jgi:hypothetical protein
MIVFLKNLSGGKKRRSGALTRIRDDQVDSKLLDLAEGGTGEESEVALKLIGERNPEGGKELLQNLLSKKRTPSHVFRSYREDRRYRIW